MNSSTPANVPKSKTATKGNSNVTTDDYLTEFQTGIEKFRELALDQEEIQCKEFSLSIRGSSTENGHHVNSCKPSSQTRLDSNVLCEINNLEQQKKLLSPLISLLKSLESKIASRNETSNSHLMHQQILTAFYVFKCYNLVSYQDRCAKLASKLKRVNPYESLITLTMHLSVALDVADMERAHRVVREGESVSKEVKKLQNGIDSFETIHFFLLKCDCLLRLGKMETVAEELRTLLAGDYFERPTVNRFYLKALALNTASKFPGDAYRHSSSLEEFSEPLFLCYTVIRTWNRSIHNPESPLGEMSIKPSEPLWFQYAMYWMFLTSYDLFAHFNINNDNPLETEFFHNYALSICRQNCFLFWSRKLLVTAAIIDWLTDKPDHAMTKVNLSNNFFNSRNMTSILENRSASNEPNSDDESGKDESETFSIKTTLHSHVQQTSEDDCLHRLDGKSLRANLYRLKRSNMNLPDDEDTESSLTSRFDVAKFMSSEPEKTEIYKADAVKLESLILLVLLNYSSPRDRILQLSKIQITNIINNSLCQAREIAKTTTRPDSATLSSVRKELLECTRDLLTFRLRLWLNRIHIESFELIGDRMKALALASSFFKKSFTYRVDCFEGYASRAQFGNFCCIYSRLLFNSTVALPEYDSASSEEITKSAIEFQRSPSPQRSRSRGRAAKVCPPLDFNVKSKNAYKVPEMQEYYQKLGDVILDETNLPRMPTAVNESVTSRYKQIIDQISSSAPSEFERTAEKKVDKKRRVVPRSKDAKEKEVKSVSSDLSSAISSLSLKEKVERSNIMTVASELSPSTENGTNFCQTLIEYMGPHPPANFYRDVQYQIAMDHLNNGRINEAGHHLSEMAAVAFRYHAIRVANKRTKRKKSINFPLSKASFTPSDTLTLEQNLAECPPTWRMIQISITGHDKPGPSLLVTRFQKDMPPIVLKIKSTPQKHVKNFMDTLLELLEQSNNSIIDKDPNSFWKVRVSLDLRLKELMKSVETAWFGPWRGLFIGSVSNPAYHKLVRELSEELIAEAEKKKHSINNKSLLHLLIESAPLLDERDFSCGMTVILQPFSRTFSSQAYRKVRAKVDKSEFKQIFSGNASHPFGPVGLILGSGLDLLPWECLPTPLSLDQQFFRVPSLRFLSVLIQRWKTLVPAPDSTYYLLNPANNLKKTQMKFEEKFKSMNGWVGCIGAPPESDELQSGLEKCDVYIFFGHGAGSCYYRKLPSNLEGVDLKTISLVIGCSSGRLRREGSRLEATGTPYRFLLNGSPSYLGVLWDVTDVDIDSYSDSMLSTWLPGWSSDSSCRKKLLPASLAHAATRARQACKLKHIIGSAPVVYGLPLACSISVDKIK